MAAQFPNALPESIEVKSETRDTSERSDEFWNGADGNRIRDELIALARNLGPSQKFDPTAVDDSVVVGSGTCFLGSTKVEFDGDTVTLTDDAFVWVTISGTLESGSSLPDYPHVPVAFATFSGTAIEELDDIRVMVDGSGGITASGTTYSPASPGLWPAPIPSGVGEALDSIINVLVGPPAFETVSMHGQVASTQSETDDLIASILLDFDNLPLENDARLVWNQSAYSASGTEVRLDNVTDAVTLLTAAVVGTGVHDEVFDASGLTGVKLLRLYHSIAVSGSGPSTVEGGQLMFSGRY